MAESLFEELKRYVAFSAVDETVLRLLYPVASPHFQEIAEIFYDRILTHADARKALEGGESQVGRLKETLVTWMGGVLQGPWDEAYFERRCRIGRVHVRIALPQHYMFGAMNVLRREFNLVIDSAYSNDLEKLSAARTSVSKIMDLELAIMLHTYREDLLAQQVGAERQISEKLAAVVTLAAGLSHEIRNPLNAAGLQLEVLERRIQKLSADLRPALHEPVLLVREEVRRLEHLLQDFLQFARPREIRSTPVDMALLLGRVLDFLAEETDRRGIRVERQLEPTSALGDSDRLQQVLMNVCLNGIEAMSTGGHLRARTAQMGQQIVVIVEDAGAGISAEAQKHIFEPFFTTKASGTGLGLPIVHAIVEQHGGSISVGDREGGGTRFEIRLPAS